MRTPTFKVTDRISATVYENGGVILSGSISEELEVTAADVPVLIALLQRIEVPG